MISEIVYLVLSELSNVDVRQPNTESIIVPHVVMILLTCFTFRILCTTRMLVRMSIDMLVLGLLCQYGNKFIAYSFSVFQVLNTLQKLCISPRHTAVFGAVVIFLIPIYIFHWGFKTQQMHYALAYPVIMDAWMPLEPFL